MEVIKTKIEGCYIIKRPFFRDDRGYFSRGFDKKILEENGMYSQFVQSNISQNEKRYTLRGLHSQKAPYEEDKLITCTRGKVWDVCVDVRPDSVTYKEYVALELTEENGMALYIPKGCAHGYVTLEDNSQVVYYATQEYKPNSEDCYRFDDPAFEIDWKCDVKFAIISEKDRGHKFIGDR